MSWISALLGLDASKNQGKASAAQSALLKQQRMMMEQAQPYMQALMQWYAQNAGLKMPGMGGIGGGLGATPGIAGNQGVPRTQPIGGMPGKVPFGAPRATAGGGAPTTQPTGGVPGLPNSAVGIYGSNPADVFRLQAAEEDVNRLARQRAQQLQYRLGQQGLGGSATMGAALARNEGDALSQLAAFRRNLAMNAGQEQQQRMSQLLNALNPMLGQGPALAQQYGQMANQWGQQQQQQQQQLMQLAMMFAGG